MAGRVADAIRELRKASGLGVLMTEQNSRLALELADRVVVFDQGHLAHSGSAADFRRDPELSRHFLTV